MAPKDILVVLDETERSSVRLDLAAALAKRHDARLNGVAALGLLPSRDFSDGGPDEATRPLGPPILAGLYAPAVVPAEAAKPGPYSPPEQAERIGQVFREGLRRYGLAGDWESLAGAPGEAVAARARKSDLVVLGQPDPEQPAVGSVRSMVEDVLLTAGRPLLLVPFAGTFPTLGLNALIGWRESREAARAVHDALGLIEPGAKLTVLTVRRGPVPAGRVELPGEPVARHLARHGFKAESAEAVAEASLPASFIVRPMLSEADALLNYASDIAADLLVVGGYGHSRTRELVLGGVTRDLLGHMTLPVLMSH